MLDFDALTPTPAYDEAPKVLLVDNEVVLVGPGPIAFSMTRNAAREMCRRLAEALKDSDPPSA